MKYFLITLNIIILAIGILMMVINPEPSSPPFMSGVAFTAIALYHFLAHSHK